MNAPLQFDPKTQQLVGPVGNLRVRAADHLAHRFLMPLEGEWLEEPIGNVAQRYGFGHQRYYQLLQD